MTQAPNGALDGCSAVRFPILCERFSMAAVTFWREIFGRGSSKPMKPIERSRWGSDIVEIAELREAAKRRLPRVVFDYLDGGADGEVTLRENCRVFDDVIFRPRQAVRHSGYELRARLLGFALCSSRIPAPVGYIRMMHPGGELAAAAAEGEAGTIYTLSTVSGHKLEDVRAASKGPVWYQLYLVGGREVAEAALERAKKAEFSALVVTVDTAVAGNRERDLRNGMKQLLGGSVFSRLPYLWQFLERPLWLANYFLDGGRPALENIV